MNKEQLNEKAQEAFDFNKNLNVAFVTIDGTVFPNKNLANIYAKGLDSTEIYEAKRDVSVLKKVKDKLLKTVAGGKAGFENNEEARKAAAEEEAAKLLTTGEGGQGENDEMTTDQMILRLVKDFTKEELQAVASEFELPKNRFLMMKEETLANFLITETTEVQKELLLQKIEDKKED